jgi:hypothetical protein
MDLQKIICSRLLPIAVPPGVVSFFYYNGPLKNRAPSHQTLSNFLLNLLKRFIFFGPYPAAGIKSRPGLSFLAAQNTWNPAGYILKLK